MTRSPRLPSRRGSLKPLRPRDTLSPHDGRPASGICHTFPATEITKRANCDTRHATAAYFAASARRGFGSSAPMSERPETISHLAELGQGNQSDDGLPYLPPCCSNGSAAGTRIGGCSVHQPPKSLFQLVLCGVSRISNKRNSFRAELTARGLSHILPRNRTPRKSARRPYPSGEPLTCRSPRGN